jgi:hypothetical protein
MVANQNEATNEMHCSSFPLLFDSVMNMTYPHLLCLLTSSRPSMLFIMNYLFFSSKVRYPSRNCGQSIVVNVIQHMYNNVLINFKLGSKKVFVHHKESIKQGDAMSAVILIISTDIPTHIHSHPTYTSHTLTYMSSHTPMSHKKCK